MSKTSPRQALLLADLHLHHLPQWRFDWCDEFITDLLAEQTEGQHLFILGDVLEVRDNVPSKTLNSLLRLLAGWHAGDVIWLSGQHDSYIPGHATLEAVKDFGVIVVDGKVYHHKLTDSWFVPFAREDEVYRQHLAKVPDDAVVFTHLPIVEAIEMFGAKDVQGIKLEEFQRFRHTFSGDIHCWHDFDKFSYIGAPSQRDWRDKNVAGCFGILDGITLHRSPTIHPKHIEVASWEDVPAEGEYIVKVPRGVEKSETAGVVLDSVEVFDTDLDSIQLVGVGSLDELVQTYIRENPPPEGITKKQAREYGESLLKTALSDTHVA